MNFRGVSSMRAMTFFILVIFLFLSPSTPALATDPAYLVLKDGGRPLCEMAISSS